MRDINQIHPVAKAKALELVQLCKANGILIKIGECLRTVAEQDALYAKGRTAAGAIVTNCKGSSYSSMHQWGVAFDIYLDMDVDGDGVKSDDAFNNATGLFDKVGKLGQSIGLEWGGTWKSIKDRPHFQLPDWGSTATKLKSTYGTPEKFLKTWNSTQEKTEIAPVQQAQVVVAKNTCDPAKSKNKSLAGKYKVTAKSGLNLRMGPSTKKSIITVIPFGTAITCWGYHTGDWYLVEYGKNAGYVSKNYLKKILV